MTVSSDQSSVLEKRAELEEWLKQAAGARRVSVASAKPLSGGAIQENWRVELEIEGGDHAGRLTCVLRRDAPSSVAVSLSRPQEFALLRVARQAGVKVPEPLWLCEDPEILERPFYLMRFLEGVALGPKVVKDPSLGGDREALAEELGRQMARIHSIRPPCDALSFLEMPKAAPALDAVERYRAFLDDLGEARPSLEWGLTWAERHAPSMPKTITLVHQDFRTGNYMVDQDGLVAVLDWEFCAWGDPMSDLGWFLAACWRFGRPDLEAGGIGSREAFFRGYRSQSDLEIDESAVTYWEVVAHIRWAVIALQQGARHVSGAEQSLELALTGRLIAGLEQEILMLTHPDRWSVTP